MFNFKLQLALYIEVSITFLSHFCINIFSLRIVDSSNTALLWETKNVCVQFKSSVTSPIINDDNMFINKVRQHNTNVIL